MTHYLKHRRGGDSSPYPDAVAFHMGNNAGFFPATAEDLDRFAREYLHAVGALDAVAVWFNPGESDLAREFCREAELVPLRSLEPYYHRVPWSAKLAGKRVLVIHPFADSIADNYAHIRQVLFEDPSVLPAFELRVLKAVQSIAGEETEFASWFDALDHMKSEMEAVEFDVCIVGAGAYGLPLAAYAKAMGKVAIHMGGATQVLFGIRGRRWDEHEVISKFYNEHWTRPRPSETPAQLQAGRGRGRVLVSSMSDRPLGIGVVPILDGSQGGVYQYSVTMLDGLLAIEPRPNLVLFTDRRGASQAQIWQARGYRVLPLWPQTARWKLGRIVSRIPGAGRVRRVKAEAALAEWIARSGVDFLVFPTPQTVVFGSGLPYVIAVHDLQHRIHPEFPEVSADGEWDVRERLFRNSLANALTVLVDSDVGREDVLDCYGELVSPERVKVLPFLPAPYLDAAKTASMSPAVRERLGLPEQYLFFPAQFWPHKNHVRVVRAVAQIRSERGVDVHVVMCGSAADPLRASVLEKVRRAAGDEGVSDLIHLPGYVDDELMAPLYAGSRGLLLPTFFGPTNIPILEAWALGVPVLTSDLRGIREQCGNAAILVDPSSVAAIAEGVYALWSDERRRKRLVSAGTKRLAQYGRPDYLARLSAVVEDAGRRARQGAREPEEPASVGGESASKRPPAPVVSVIIPAHNRAASIASAIESVRSQSFGALEIVVVDDGSDDRTPEIARAIAEHEPRLRVLSHPENRGAQAARNTGIRAARGEWIAFLDSDDVYYRESIELRLDAARRADLQVVHSACDAVGPDGKTPFPVPPVQGNVYRSLLTAPAPMFQGLIVKRDLLHRIGLLDEAVPAYQEWDTSIRLAAIASFGFVETPTFLYDLRTRGAISRDSRRAADGYEHVVSAHWGEVLRVAGLRVLASHYRIVAEIRIQAGDRRGAYRCAVLSQLMWPLSPRRTLRLLRAIARAPMSKGPARSSAADE